jgi:hypothetical protein
VRSKKHVLPKSFIGIRLALCLGMLSINLVRCTSGLLTIFPIASAKISMTSGLWSVGIVRSKNTREHWSMIMIAGIISTQVEVSYSCIPRS